MGWAVALKGAKGVLTAIEIIDGVADAATLGDEIAKAAMGDDYDPGFRDKCQEVADAGKRVDALVAKLKAKQDDASNLEAAIKQLNLSLSLYDDKNELVVDLIDKVGAFSETMSQTPTALTWIEGPAARMSKHQNHDELVKSIVAVERYATQLKFSPVNTALLSTTLSIKALVFSYKIRQRRKSRVEAGPVDGTELRPIPNRERRNAFSGMEILPKKDQKALKRLRRKTKLATTVDVVSKVGSAVSLGYTIVNIVNRVSNRNQAIAAFDKQLEEYRRAEKAYNYCLNGFKAYPDSSVTSAARELNKLRDEAALLDSNANSITVATKKFEEAETKLWNALKDNQAFKSAKKYFTEITVDKWDQADDIGFAYGVEGLIDQYNALGEEKISAIRSIFDDMTTTLSGEKDRQDPVDKLVEKYVIDTAVLNKLKADKEAFEKYAQIARDVALKSQERKDDGFEPIQKNFDTSLQTLLSKVIADASTKLREIRFASQLFVTAKRILNDAKKEEGKTQARVKIASEQDANIRKFVKQSLESQGKPANEAAVTQYMQDNGLGSSVETFSFDNYVNDSAVELAKQEWVASDLNTEPTPRFPDEDSALVCLKLMLVDLRNSGTAHITNKYVWMPKEHALPVVFDCTFVCNDEKSAFIPCFSKEQETWSGDNTECLSWFMSTNRSDFTFRTNLFGDTPNVVRHTPGFNAEVGKVYTMKCEIERETATYWINGKKYATATYGEKAVPDVGYVGFAVYGKTDVKVDNILIN